MITKAQVKHIQSLDDKKYRSTHQLFVVEGTKMVNELLNSKFKIKTLYAVSDWLNTNQIDSHDFEIVEVEDFELARISSLKTPNQVLAIVHLPNNSTQSTRLAILLDGLQDPGNLGSIIRIADWYHISTIYCSENCADAYNSKVIQASMGSVFRINIVKSDLLSLLETFPDIPSYACVLDGNDINSFPKIQEGFIIIGNESKGIQDSIISKVKHKVTILPKGGAESLNAAVATGIICHCMLS